MHRPATLGRSSAALLLVSLLGADAPPADRSAALDRISADSLRGHVSFLASDELEGRDTPSKGLDVAATYIASQFRGAGLEPAGDDGFFQVARWTAEWPDEDGFRLEIRAEGKEAAIGVRRVSFPRTGPLDVRGAGLVKIDARDEKALSALTPERVEGRVLLAEAPEPVGGNRRAAAADPAARLRARLAPLKPALLLLVDRKARTPLGLGRPRLIDPERSGGLRLTLPIPGPPTVTVHDPRAIDVLDSLPAGPTGATVSLHLGPPVSRPVRLRNVVGKLPGSDPALRDSFVLVSAHYDHLGLGAGRDGDRIYNGANDDASGTAAVVELASALGRLKERPRRTLVFLTFFGEEKGLLGSRYYARHPAVPVARTVAALNLEQVGRTDDLEGPRVAAASLTGFDYSDVGPTLRSAAKAEGVAISGHPRFSDLFFARSDNQALADLGIPAHTLCTSFMFPDYHGPADHWDKLDYPNMARVTRAVARGLLTLADRDDAPAWNESNAKAARYAKLRKDGKNR